MLAKHELILRNYKISIGNSLTNEFLVPKGRELLQRIPQTFTGTPSADAPDIGTPFQNNEIMGARPEPLALTVNNRLLS